jgi:hypothetical protein
VLPKLVELQQSSAPALANAVPSSCASTVASSKSHSDVVVEANSLVGCFYNWYTLELWHTSTQKKQ